MVLICGTISAEGYMTKTTIFISWNAYVDLYVCKKNIYINTFKDKFYTEVIFDMQT